MRGGLVKTTFSDGEEAALRNRRGLPGVSMRFMPGKIMSFAQRVAMHKSRPSPSVDDHPCSPTPNKNAAVKGNPVKPSGSGPMVGAEEVILSATIALHLSLCLIVRHLNSCQQVVGCRQCCRTARTPPIRRRFRRERGIVMWLVVVTSTLLRIDVRWSLPLVGMNVLSIVTWRGRS